MQLFVFLFVVFVKRNETKEGTHILQIDREFVFWPFSLVCLFSKVTCTMIYTKTQKKNWTKINAWFARHNHCQKTTAGPAHTHSLFPSPFVHRCASVPLIGVRAILNENVDRRAGRFVCSAYTQSSAHSDKTRNLFYDSFYGLWSVQRSQANDIMALCNWVFQSYKLWQFDFNYNLGAHTRTHCLYLQEDSRNCKEDYAHANKMRYRVFYVDYFEGFPSIPSWRLKDVFYSTCAKIAILTQNCVGF